jgi:hypothetical protein
MYITSVFAARFEKHNNRETDPRAKKKKFSDFLLLFFNTYIFMLGLFFRVQKQKILCSSNTIALESMYIQKNIIRYGVQCRNTLRCVQQAWSKRESVCDKCNECVLCVSKGSMCSDEEMRNVHRSTTQSRIFLCFDVNFSYHSNPFIHYSLSL